MSKLLVNAPSGAQEIIEVGDGGGYFDTARVLWDEREDGPLPEITLGGMVRSGAELVFSQPRMDEHNAVINPPYDRQRATVQIDEAVAAIYGRFTRFQLEYTEREAQAQAYKDAGYTGPVPPRVSEFATPAGMPAQAATDLILAQAVNLRTAQGALSALRMRKYEVLRAATDAEAQAVAAEILAGIAVIGGQVS